MGNICVLACGLVGRWRENLVNVFYLSKFFYMAKKTLKKLTIKVFASVVKTVFPKMAVKFFTKKMNGSLFLPGVQKEVKLIKELKLPEQELMIRAWSKGTCEALMKQNDFSLWFLAQSEEAYDLVSKNGGNTERTCKIFSRNTPKVDYLRKWLKNSDENYVVRVLNQTPNILNDLQVEDLQVKGSYYYLEVLLNTSNFYHWSKKIFEKWYDKSYMLTESDKNLFFTVTMNLVAADYEFNGEMLSELKKHHFDAYKYLTMRVKNSQYLSQYVLEVLPREWYKATDKALETLGPEGSISEDKDNPSFEEEEVGALWMKYAMKCLKKDPEIFNYVIENVYDNPSSSSACSDQIMLMDQMAQAITNVSGEKFYHGIKKALKELPVRYREKLENNLYNSISTAEQAVECLEILPESFRDKILNKFVKIYGKEVNLFTKFWPFTDWSLEQAEKVIRRLAVVHEMPTERISELTPELQKVAFEELEIQSELRVLELGYNQEKATLITHPLHPRSEVFLFTENSAVLEEYASDYISHFCMAESSFAQLVSKTRDASGTAIYDKVSCLIKQHAQVHGLSKKNYLDLMNSDGYSTLAPVLKGCYKPEGE